MAFLNRVVKPRLITGLLFILVGMIVGALGMRGRIAGSHDGSIHASPLAIIAGETMIVVGLLLLAWALFRLIVSALAAR
jgi:sulfite exporter TauE/SafE